MHFRMGAFFGTMRLAFHTLSLFTCGVLLLVPGWAGEFGDPSGFLADERIEAKNLDGGMRWERVTGMREGVPQVLHVVMVDLAQPNLNLALLRGNRLAIGTNQFHLRSTVSQLLEDSGAALAINASFFDIGATQTPFGLLVDDQALLRTPANNRTVLAVTVDKEVHIGNFAAVVLCRYGGAAPVIQSVNGNSIADHSLHLYRHPWERSPGSGNPIAKGVPLTEVVLETTRARVLEDTSGLMSMSCRVVGVRDGMEPVMMGPDQAVLCASGTMRDFLREMAPGEELEILWRISGGGLQNAAWNIRTAVAGSAHLVIKGVAASANTAHWNDRHPRSAVGIAADRQRMVFVLVEGRMPGRAEGLSLHDMARLLLHLGASEGLELDGGGSSALAGRIAGGNALLNVPSGGSERYVPVGLGVMETPSSSYPFFEDVRTSASEREAIVTWSTPEPALAYVVLEGEHAGRTVWGVAQAVEHHAVHLTLDAADPARLQIRLRAERAEAILSTPPITIVPGLAESEGPDVPRWWARHYFGSDSADGDADPDADGFSNAAEFRWGTDPTRAVGRPHFSVDLDASGAAGIRFAPYVAGRPYRLWEMPFGQTAFVSRPDVSPSADERGGAVFPIESKTGNSLHIVEVSSSPPF